MNKLHYGIRNNCLAHISEVQSGLSCNCTCPSCGAQLVAKKGSTREQHFAHYSVADCGNGAESALHRLAKEIILSSRTVFVPNLPRHVCDFRPDGKLIQFTSAAEEVLIAPEIRGDVLLQYDSRQLNVEILVTHAIDEKKLIQIFNHGIATIEIDLSDMPEDYTKEMVSNWIANGVHTKLLFSPKKREIYAKRILGELKEVKTRYNFRFVENCPYDDCRAFFVGGGSRHGCHECYGYEERTDSDKLYLCRGLYGNLSFEKIEKIVDLVRVDGHVVYADVIVNGNHFILNKKESV